MTAVRTNCKVNRAYEPIRERASLTCCQRKSVKTETILFNIALMSIWSSLGTVLAITVIAGLTGKPLHAPLQAISHIVFGKQAYEVEKANLIYMVVGFVLNAFAMIMWSVVAEFAFLLIGVPPRNGFIAALVVSIVTVVAYIVDFRVVPKRFTPGFEHVLNKHALTAVYVLLAISLFCGAMGRLL